MQEGEAGSAQAEHDAVVLEVAVVDEDECGLEADGEQRDRLGAPPTPLELARDKERNGRQVDEQIAHDDGGTHERRRRRILVAPRRYKRESDRRRGEQPASITTPKLTQAVSGG